MDFFVITIEVYYDDKKDFASRDGVTSLDFFKISKPYFNVQD